MSQPYNGKTDAHTTQAGQAVDLSSSLAQIPFIVSSHFIQEAVISELLTRHSPQYLCVRTGGTFNAEASGEDVS